MPPPLTPITTVSSPLNLGMNLSPRRISASLRGRNRHITLMLHSAGSAISTGRREGLGGRESARPRRRPRTAPPAARPPPAASNEASQQVMANSADGQLWPLRDWVGGQSISIRPRGLQTYLPWSCPALRCAPSPPARDHAAGGRGDAHRASLARLRPPGLLRAQPSCISTSALHRLPGPPLRPFAPPSPGPPRAITSLQRSDLAPSTELPGTCSRPTCKGKGKDAWSWLLRIAVVPPGATSKSLQVWCGYPSQEEE